MRTEAQIEALNIEWTAATKHADILRLALDDVQYIIENDHKIDDFNVQFFMEQDWCDRVGPKENKRCSVCLAGAVMIRRFTATINQKLFDEWGASWVTPNTLETAYGSKYKLGALDYWRKGEIPYTHGTEFSEEFKSDLAKLFARPFPELNDRVKVNKNWLRRMRKVQELLKKYDY